MILSGELKNSRRRFRNLDLGSTDTITMTINDNDNVAKTYDCSFTKGSPSELKCDTSSDPITTSAEKIHLSTGNSTDGTLLTVEIKTMILIQQQIYKHKVLLIDIFTIKVQVV